MIVELGPLTIKLDVLVVQLINLAILFWIFKKLFGDTLVKEIAKRKELTTRLHQADEEYQALLDKAQTEKEVILSEAHGLKNAIVQDAHTLAQQEKDKILAKAKIEAGMLLDKAQADAVLQARDLETNFVQGVKTTSLALVKKLFTHPEAQESYLNGLVDEFTHSYKQS